MLVFVSKHSKQHSHITMDSRGESSMKGLVGVVSFFAIFLLIGCATSGLENTDSPKTCPGVPPGHEFGLTTGDMLSNMELMKANNAALSQEWELSEYHYQNILQSGKASKAIEKFSATALVHSLCMQGKYKKANSISQNYDVPF